MPRTASAPDPALIARLEAASARNPAGYRLRLGALAVAGDLALILATALPVAVLVLIAVMIYNNRYVYWIGAAAVVLFVWLLRPTFRIEGRALSRAEAPKLFAELEALREKLRVPGRMEVMLDESFNAGATETRGLLGLAGTRSVLTLGVPLLAALGREQVLAVVAHEFGHFSRRHGRLGHWLYRARVGWMHYAEYVTDSDSPYFRALARYAEMFVPYFSSRCFVHSRRCEYEADADGASAVGVRTFAAALAAMMVYARLWETGFPRRLREWKGEILEAPTDIHERFSAAAAEWPEKELQDWLDEALRAPSTWTRTGPVTHPSLGERLGALKEKPRLVRTEGGAGRELLGEAWPSVLAEFDAKWRESARVEWAIEHLRRKYMLDPPRGLAELRALHAREPRDPTLAFALGAALLAENDASGVDLLEGVAKDHPAFRAPAYVRLLAYQERRGDAEAIERSHFRLLRAMERRAVAVNAFLEKADRGEIGESALPAAARAVLSEALALDPDVKAAILIGGDSPLATQESATAAVLRVHCLILTIDPAPGGGGEAEVIERYEAALELLVGPGEQAVVRTYFSTEPLPQVFQSRAKLRG